MNINNLNKAIEDFSKIKTECEKSNLKSTPILIFNKEKNIYEITFISELHIAFSEKYEMIKK